VDVSHKVLTVNMHGECSKEQPVAASRTGCLRFIELAGTGESDPLEFNPPNHHLELSYFPERVSRKSIS
jgi:hypothetical protein